MNTERPLILIVDDDPDLRGLIRDVLSLEGFEVEEARDGAQCLQKADKLRPSIIFLDVDMPGLKGWEVCQQLKKSPSTKDIPVVIMSAHAQREDKEKALASGASHYLSKPADVDILLPLIKKLTDPRPS